jgi:dehydrogenase/reductase SDR family protein 1
MAPSLAGRIALVTGASRGIGRGIALQLGEAGATVYITGRKAADLEKTCSEIKARGGNGIAIVMDHSNDTEVENLFERIKKEQNGRLDVCVNNAYAGVNAIVTSTGKKFYNTPAAEMWDDTNGVGLRNHYLCTVYASRLLFTSLFLPLANYKVVGKGLRIPPIPPLYLNRYLKAFRNTFNDA